MAYKNKEKAKEYRAYYEQHIRSEESKKRKKEATRLWILRKREERDKRELQNGKDLGYEGIKIQDNIRKRIEAGITKILINEDRNITCFHKNEDGHWVNNTGKKKYLHREVIKKELGLTDEDLKGYVVHHKDGDKDNNDISNLEIITQREHVSKYHKDICAKNLAKGRGRNNI